MDIINIVGYAATICLVLGYLPQTIHTIRTRRTDDIATGTFLLMGLGSILFALNGLLTHNWPLFIANSLTTIMSAIIFGIKMYNDYWSKDAKNKKSKK